MEHKIKKRLRRKSKEIRLRYFANPIYIIEEILNSIDNSLPIDENKCEIIFDVPISYEYQIYELFKFYPIKLKQNRIINEYIINEMYSLYGETIDIMKNCRKGKLKSNPRGKICANAASNSKRNGCMFNLISEDIILTKKCPILDIELDYNNKVILNNSPSIDKIIPENGYLPDNIQIVSMLANQMKSSATKDQLIKFSKKILEIYDTH